MSALQPGAVSCAFSKAACLATSSAANRSPEEKKTIIHQPSPRKVCQKNASESNRVSKTRHLPDVNQWGPVHAAVEEHRSLFTSCWVRCRGGSNSFCYLQTQKCGSNFAPSTYLLPTISPPPPATTAKVIYEEAVQPADSYAPVVRKNQQAPDQKEIQPQSIEE